MPYKQAAFEELQKRFSLNLDRIIFKVTDLFEVEILSKETLRMLVNAVIRVAMKKGYTCYYVTGGEELTEQTIHFFKKYREGTLSTETGRVGAKK